MYLLSGSWLPVLAQYSILTPLRLSSAANPWLDFLPASQAWDLALQLNNDIEKYCSTSPTIARGQTPLKRLYGFGLLPLVPEISTLALLESVYQIASLPHLRGLIMGTRGIGKGLDDQALDPVWAAIEKAGLVVFIHPHYGVGAQAWGENDNGHVLPLALGFPFETTTVSLCITVFVQAFSLKD
jgi:aminocarboxymuconate-semialdehyde decarboxylase